MYCTRGDAPTSTVIDVGVVADIFRSALNAGSPVLGYGWNVAPPSIVHVKFKL